MAAVLFMGSSMSMASSNFELNEPDAATCFTYADSWATIVGFWNSLSHEDEHKVFESLYDDCMSQ